MKYLVLKDFLFGMKTLCAKGSIFEPVWVDDQFRDSLIRHGFIAPVDLRWKAGNNERWFYVDTLGSVRSNLTNASNRGKKLFVAGNMFRSQETADRVAMALTLFFEYLHTVPGTPQQNIKNDLEHAHSEARKAVIADDEATR